MGAGSVGFPTWSHDSQEVVFHSRIDGQADLYIADVETGVARRLTRDSADDVLPEWSRDGRWIYFASARSGDFSLWAIEADGGKPHRITEATTVARSRESPEGAVLYYFRRQDRAIWKIPIKNGRRTGPDELVTTTPLNDFGFAVTSQGVYYRRDNNTIELFGEAEGRVIGSWPIKGPPTDMAGVMSVSPDGSRILYHRATVESDLFLLESVE